MFADPKICREPAVEMVSRRPPPDPMAIKPRFRGGTAVAVPVPSAMEVGMVVAMISSATPPVVTLLMRPRSSAVFPPLMMRTCGAL